MLLGKLLGAYVWARWRGLGECGVMDGKGALSVLPGTPRVSDDPSWARRPVVAPRCLLGESLSVGVFRSRGLGQTVVRERSLRCAVIALRRLHRGSVGDDGDGQATRRLRRPSLWSCFFLRAACRFPLARCR